MRYCVPVCVCAWGFVGLDFFCSFCFCSLCHAAGQQKPRVAFQRGRVRLRLVPAVRMWERTCGLELLGSVASILATVDCARGMTADGVFHLQDLRLQVAQVLGSHSCRWHFDPVLAVVSVTFSKEP